MLEVVVLKDVVLEPVVELRALLAAPRLVVRCSRHVVVSPAGFFRGWAFFWG